MSDTIKNIPFDVTLKVKEVKSDKPCEGCIFRCFDCSEIDEIPGCGGENEYGKEYYSVFVLSDAQAEHKKELIDRFLLRFNLSDIQPNYNF